jgi:hypothetical protein
MTGTTLCASPRRFQGRGYLLVAGQGSHRLVPDPTVGVFISG